MGLKYQANFTKGGLLIAESRVVAALLLDGVSDKEWHQAIGIDNVLRKRSPSSAMTIGGLVKRRLLTMQAPLWELLSDGSRETATHAALAMTIKYSRLVGDFLDITVRQCYRQFERTLLPRHWDEFIEDCRARQPDMPQWQESTHNKLRTRAFNMLADAGFTDGAKQPMLRPATIDPAVLSYLHEHNERYVLRCIQVGP